MAERRRVIALVTDAIAPYNRGGKESRTQELAPRLAERAEVHVYTMNWWRGARTRREGRVTYHAMCPYVPLYTGHRRSIRQALTFALFSFRLLFARFDVIEADSMPYIQLIPLKIVALLRRRRLIVTWHESWGPEYWRTYLGRAGVFGWMFESLAIGLADGIIAASPQTGERLTALGRSRGPVTVAPNGIDFGAIDAALPHREGADIVTVGRLLAHKRVDLLIDAVAELRARGCELTVDVVGIGPELEALRAHAQRRGLAELVRFRQDVAGQSDLYALMKSARVAVFPSEREGFGIAVLEALACGVPVVVTSAPDNLARFLVSRSPEGTVCASSAAALADAVESVLQRPPHARPQPAEWLHEYDWEVVCDSVAGALA